MFENIVLEEYQKDLISKLVEIERSFPPEDRRKFIVTQSGDSITHTFIYQGGSRLDGHLRDIEVLARHHLVSLSKNPSGTPNFYVTPEGFKYYQKIKQSGLHVENVEKEIRSCFSSKEFTDFYPKAFAKWKQAETLLWETDSNTQLTTIGHLCREAMQEFATVLVEKHKLGQVKQDKAQTASRIRSVINFKKKEMGKTKTEFLDALLNYWGNTADLVQRQEHGGQKEGEPITWEDARRVTFQTMIVMYELSRTL